MAGVLAHGATKFQHRSHVLVQMWNTILISVFFLGADSFRPKHTREVLNLSWFEAFIPRFFSEPLIISLRGRFLFPFLLGYLMIQWFGFQKSVAILYFGKLMDLVLLGFKIEWWKICELLANFFWEKFVNCSFDKLFYLIQVFTLVRYNAFLCGDLQEVHKKQPIGFVAQREYKKICHLKKSKDWSILLVFYLESSMM